MGPAMAAPKEPRAASARKSPAALRDARAGREPEPAPTPEIALRRCACGGSCPRCRGDAIHPKLAINTPGDAFEREADAAAEAVTSASPAAAPSPAPPALRRCACGGSCSSCGKKKEETEEELQREEGGAGSAPGFAPPVVHQVLSSPGRPLDAPTRGFMEGRFGADFSAVRVHDDARAAESARAVDAHAYTVGSDVVFGAGRYAPGTAAGRRLLAHELAHTLQQGGMARRLQRACGVAGIGTPAGCTPRAAEWLFGFPTYGFDVNCDTLAAGEQARMVADAPTLPATVEVHGYASTDGDPAFNQDLSCARALKARDVLTAPAPGGAALPASRIGGVFSHGPTPGAAAARMSVVLTPPAPTPAPRPGTVPTPGAADFQIERVKTSTESRIYFARGKHDLTRSARLAIAALRSSPPGPIRLVGFISGDEPDALAEKRAEVVRAALTKKPGGVKVRAPEGRPDTMRDTNEYADARSVQVLVGKSAKAARDCAEKDKRGNLVNPPVLPCPTLDPDTWTAFNTAWPIAKDAMAAASKAVGATPNLPLIKRFFGNDDPATLAALRTNVPRLETQVGRLGGITKCSDHCDSGKCSRSSTIAHNTGFNDKAAMTLCVPMFKSLDHVNDQARNLIHESAHGTTPLGGPAAPGEGTQDVAYRHERMLFLLSPADRLRNSDSYALFALFALEEKSLGAGATPPGIEVPANDALVGFLGNEEPAVRLALARAEKRLAWSATRTGQLFGRAQAVRKGKASWTAGAKQTDLMAEAAAGFPLTAPPAAPTLADETRLAAIVERYQRMLGSTKADLTVTRVSAGVASWGAGTGWLAGTAVEIGPEFFLATPDDQVSLLVEALAHATPDVEAAYVPAYVSLAAFIHAQNP